MKRILRLIQYLLWRHEDWGDSRVTVAYFEMLILVFSILLSSLPFAKCQQGICFNKGAGGSCEVEGYSVPKSEISNLQDNCIRFADDDGAFDQNLNWLVLRGTHITGLEPVSNLCRYVDPGVNLSWIIWNEQSELFKGNEFFENTNIFAKSRGFKRDVYCSLNTQSGYCKVLFPENAEFLHNANFYLLVELKPIRYELRILGCEDKFRLRASDVVLAKKKISNFESESKIIKDTIAYTAITRLKFELDDIRIPIRKDLPFRVLLNDSLLHESNDGYYWSETKHFPMYYRFEPGRAVELEVKMKEIKRSCEAKADLVIFHNDAVSETHTISFEAMKTNSLEPVQHVKYFSGASDTTSTKQGFDPTSPWMIVLYVICGLLILALVICCWLKFCGCVDCTPLCGVCEGCCIFCEACPNINCPG